MEEWRVIQGKRGSDRRWERKRERVRNSCLPGVVWQPRLFLLICWCSRDSDRWQFAFESPCLYTKSDIEEEEKKSLCTSKRQFRKIKTSFFVQICAIQTSYSCNATCVCCPISASEILTLPVWRRLFKVLPITWTVYCNGFRHSHLPEHN